MGVRITSPVNSTFIHLQKTGGSSIQRWLLVHTESFRFNKHAEFNFIDKHFEDPGLCFTIVRNPYARLVSWYHYYLGKTETRIRAVKDGTVEYLDVSEKKLKNKYNLEKNKQIKERLSVGFNKWLLDLKEVKNIQGQCYVAKRCSLVLKLENINVEFKKIQDLYGIYEPLYHINKSQHEHYRNYYTKETVELVKKKYERDLDYFGYEF